MTLSPQSRVRLYNNVPFDLSYEHARWFANVGEQDTYFAGLSPIKTDTKLIYVRPERGEVILNLNQEALRMVNYIAFDNGGKKYYAFVTDVTYTNQNASKVKFEIDVIQTYMFDMNFKQSFIDREHCKRWNADGTPVINTVPENLDLGTEYTTIANKIGDMHSRRKLMLITTTEKLSEDTVGTNQNLMGGVPNSLFYYLFVIHYDDGYAGLKPFLVNGTTMENKFDVVLEYLMNEQNANKVVQFSFLPFLPFDVIEYSDANSSSLNAPFLHPTENKMVTRIAGHLALKKLVDSLTDNDVYTTLKGSKITESKLLFFPYSFISMVDNAGNQMTIKPELMNTKKLEVEAKAIIDSRYKVIYSIKNYKGLNEASFEDSIINSVAPEVSVINDYTSTYLQGNKNTMIMNTVSSFVGGIATTAVGGAVAMTGGAVTIGAGMIASCISSSVGAITKHIAKSVDIDNVPNNLSKQGGSSLYNLTDRKFLPITLYKQITEEKLLMLQDYFKMYGYATNRNKTPNLRTRTHFNFIKTIGANITGGIPKDNLSILKQIFDSGITLWHTNDIFNYNVLNNER